MKIPEDLLCLTTTNTLNEIHCSKPSCNYTYNTTTCETKLENLNEKCLITHAEASSLVIEWKNVEDM